MKVHSQQTENLAGTSTALKAAHFSPCPLQHPGLNMSSNVITPFTVLICNPNNTSKCFISDPCQREVLEGMQA